MSASNPLAGAIAGLKKAGDFTTSVEGKPTGMYAKPVAPIAPVVGRISAPKQDTSFGGDIASGLAAKKRNVDMTIATQHGVSQVFAKGGKIKKDGVQTVDAEKGETVLPNKGKKRVMELAMKHLDGMKDGMEASKKKKSAKKEESKKSESKKSESKAHKKVHPYKETRIQHHSNGSHTMTHMHDTDASQDQSGAHEDDASMMGALQGAMGGGAAGGAQSLAGASAAPAAGAAPEAPAAPGAPA